MGFNLITFTKRYPYFFEALFIKFPFKYMKITQETIVLDSDLPGFDKFKHIVFDLRKKRASLIVKLRHFFHFWSFYLRSCCSSQQSHWARP